MALILPILLFFSEAHVSQSFHSFSLEKLIKMSGTILLVRKDVPYSVTDTIPTDSTGTHPDFHSLRHRYLILKVLKSESLNAKAVAKAAVKTPIKIDVDDAFKERRFEIHQEYHIRKMSIDENFWRYDFDRSTGDSDEEIIVFLTYDDNTKRYAYRIDLAMERKHALDEIEALIKPKRKFWSWLTPQGRK